MKKSSRIWAFVLAAAMAVSPAMSSVETYALEADSNESSGTEALGEQSEEADENDAESSETSKDTENADTTVTSERTGDSSEESNESSTEDKTEAEVMQKALSLTVGADESTRNITWYADTQEAGQVQYAVKDGEKFPENYETVTATVKETGDSGFYSNKATLGNLEAGTEYVYRLVNGDTSSKVYSFKTGDNDSEFSFIFVGDPEIGGTDTDTDAANWENTLQQALNENSDAELIVSAGNQVSDGNDEVQYTGFLESSILESLPLATSIGDYDLGYYLEDGSYMSYSSPAYSDHFNNPNTYGTEEEGASANSDYWYTYNNVLFLHLNSEDQDTDAHKSFMENAIAANSGKNIDWTVVVFNKSIYGNTSNAQDSQVLQMREDLSQTFTELGVNVVLMGQDNAYTRSYMMNGTSPKVSNEAKAYDSDGVLYITANSSSGSRYSTLNDEKEEYAAVTNQENTANFSSINVTADTFEITTYRSSDLSVVDSFTIEKSSEAGIALVSDSVIEGDGSETNPYLLDSDEDLRMMAEKLNANDEAWVGKYYELSADIQMTSDSFSMINSFSGVLDGKGHTIYGLTIKETEETLDGKTEHRTAFIKTNTGTIQNLRFEQAEVVSDVNSGSNSYSGAAVVVGENASGGVIFCVQVKNSTVTATGLGKAAGIAALNGRNTYAASTIQNCRFDGDISCGGNTAYGAMMGGITAYTAGSKTLVENCYTNANITYTGSSANTTVSAAMICGYPNALTIRGNVAGGGSFTIPSNVTTSNIGRIYGLYNTKYNVKTENNLANENITLNGTVITPEDSTKDSATQGKSISEDEASTKDTYTAIGWDFKNYWCMGDDSRPELKELGALTLEGSGTEEDPILIGDEEDLLYAVELLNKNDSRVAGKYLKLTADITLTSNFTMIQSFTGVLDGAGHSISGLCIVDEDTSTQKDYLIGFVRTNYGTIKDLAFESPVVKTSVVCNTDSFSGVAVIAGENANGALIHGCRVSNATVEAPNAAKVAGVTALNGRNAKNSATVSNCYVSGTLIGGGTAVSYGTMMGGIASYSSASTIEDCITDVNISCDTSNVSSQTAVVSLSGIVAYINKVTLKGNVAYGGSMNASGEIGSLVTGGIYASVPTYSGSNTIENNLSSKDITINGEAIAEAKANGTLTEKSELEEKQTYTDLGWKFDLEWKMTDEKYPIPKVFSYPENEISRITAAVNSDGIGFSWYSKYEDNTYISISEDSEMKNATKLEAALESSDDQYRFTAKASNLKSDTTYYYQVHSGNIDSEIGTFKTAKEDGAFTFINLAGTDSETVKDAGVAADTMKVALNTVSDASFILHSGSMVDAERGSAAWTEWFYQAQDTFMDTLLAPTVGDEGASVMSQQFNIDTKGYYSFDYSNAHIVVLNTSENESQCISNEQIEWLKEDVTTARGNGQKWIILSVNKGPYTTGSTADNSEVAGLREVLLPVIDELEIDLVLQGQDHILGRTYSLKDGNADKSEYMEMVNGKRFYYSLSDEGTVYFMPGQAGTNMDSQIETMTTKDLDEYIALFSRSEQRGSASNPTQTFASVTVDGDKLTVCTYERKNTDTATMIEAFGIDHEVGNVESLIKEEKWEEARTAYNALTDAQKDEVENYSALLEAENSELQENKAAWLDDSAAERRSILVRNDTFSSFEDKPIRLEIENASSETMKFYTTKGEEIPSEVESYDKNGTSIVWVKIPNIEAESVTGLWVYFGGKASTLDSSEVWSNQYALVEHFNNLGSSSMTDSTGNATGTVTGSLTENDYGADKGAYFKDSKITYDSIGDDYDAFSISAIVSMTDEDMAALTGNKGVIASRFLSTDNDTNSYQMSIDSSTGKLSTSYYAKWWREHNYNTSSWPTNQKTNYSCNISATDGNQHMVTLMYDGLTVTTYVDGVAVKKGRVFLENSIYTDKSLSTVIGAYSDETLTGAFRGTIYDVQISGTGTSEQWESFRYEAYFGNAVTIGKSEHKGDLAINADVVGRSSSMEAGNHLVQGMLSKDATVTIQVGDKTYDLGSMSAGMFTETIDMTGSGEQKVIVSATADGKTEKVELTINLTDTKDPDVEGTDTQSDGESQTLVVNPNESEDENLTTKFYLSEGVDLSSNTMSIATGSTTENTPDQVDPLTCEYTAKELSNETTTTEDGSNPYQIYKISLTDEQKAAANYQLGWHGTSSRQIHAYAYDQAQKTWVKVASTDGTGELSMNIQVEGSQYSQDGNLYLIFFRGLGTDPEDMDSYTPSEGQYDFSMTWTSDVQYTSEFYEDILLQQKKWIAENQDKYNVVMNIDTGDVANAAYLSWEYNWKTVDKAYNVLENASAPYTIVWGNHDYKYVDKYNLLANSDRLYRQYFPLSRFQENLGGWKMVSQNKVTDDMCLTQTIHGSKLMLLTLSYWMDESDISWAKNIVEDPEYADYNIIILTHHFNSGGKITSTYGKKLLSDVIQGHSNVKLLLCGHVDGVDVINPTTGGQQFYSILQDYQDESGTMIYGGNGFLRMLNFDVENNLIYFNTYSPLTGETATVWANGTYSKVDGLYQKNKDEFAISVDLGGSQERTFTTSQLCMTTQSANEVGAESSKGNETVSYKLSDLKAGQNYTWYAVIEDEAGNQTTTALSGFKTAASEEEAKLVGIEIGNAPTKTEYAEGESFSAEGMVVNAVYSDGSRKVITDYTYSPDGALSLSDTAVIVSWNGMTTQVNISVRSQNDSDDTSDSVSGVTITPDNGTLTKAGETLQLTAIVKPDNAANKNVTWTSSDTNVATVDENGLVTAVADGTVTITAVSEDGNITATASITVSIAAADDTSDDGNSGTSDGSAANSTDQKNNASNYKGSSSSSKSSSSSAQSAKGTNTGDTTDARAWGILLVIAAAAATGIYAKKRKSSK